MIELMKTYRTGVRFPTGPLSKWFYKNTLKVFWRSDETGNDVPVKKYVVNKQQGDVL